MKRYLFFLVFPLTLTIQIDAQWALLRFTPQDAELADFGKARYHFIRLDQEVGRWVDELQKIEVGMSCAWGRKSKEKKGICWEFIQRSDLDKRFKDIVKSREAIHPQALFDRKKLEVLNRVKSGGDNTYAFEEKSKELFSWYPFNNPLLEKIYLVNERNKAVDLRNFASISEEERAKLPRPVDVFARPCTQPIAISQAPPFSHKRGSEEEGENIYIMACVIVGIGGALLFRTQSQKRYRRTNSYFTHIKS